MQTKHTLLVIAMLTIAGALFQVQTTAFGQAGGGKWVTIFDGKSLRGWNPIGDANWHLVDGAVQAEKGSGFLVSSGSYENFELRVEFWVDADANSGVFIRSGDPAHLGGANSYEVNIYDKRPDQSYRTGAIVDVAKPLAQIDAGGKWNTFEITAQGPRMTVKLNGTLVADGTDSKHPRGAIGLQYGAGVVKFRKVEIRTL
jgi:hypothetical protein